jgi:hypothetical protein
MPAMAEPRAAPSRMEPKNENTVGPSASVHVPGSVRRRPAMSSCIANTAYSVFSADSAKSRSVTCPAAPHSLTTRCTTAGDTHMASTASAPAARGSTSKPRATA